MRTRWLMFCSLLLLVAPLPAQNQQPAASVLGSVSGLVVQGPGAIPVRKVQVSLESMGGELIALSLSRQRDRNPLSTVTDSEGRFRIERVPVGDYRVVLQRNGFVPAGRRSQQDSPLSVSVADGEQVDGLVFRLFPAGVIRGKITDADGDAIQSVTVMAIAASGRNISTNATTNDLGEYRLAGLAPGKYLVVAVGSGLQVAGESEANAPEVYAPTFFPGTIERAQAATVEVQAGGEVEAGFGLIATRTFSVRGQVPGLSSGASGGADAGAGSILLQRADMPWAGAASASILANGSFDIRGVLPGTYHAMVISQKGESWLPTQDTEVVEVRGADVEGLRFVPQAMGEARGRFRMDDGQPFNWAQLGIYLDPDDRGPGEGGLGGKVDKDGSFKIENVPAANYHVVVTADSDNLRDYIMKEVNVDGKDAGDSGFSTGAGVSILDIVASAKGSTIAGTLIDGENKTVYDEQVVCVPDEGRRKRHDVYQQARTDKRGQFSFRGLNSGEYLLFAVNGESSDITDPDFIQAHAASGRRIQIDQGEQKTITLKFSWDDVP